VVKKTKRASALLYTNIISAHDWIERIPSIPC
jgi:hypothetical protein